MKRTILSILLTVTLLGCASTTGTMPPTMSASFYDMKKDSFSLEAIAPADVIREYAICKAIWFAEKKNGTKVSLSDPVYNNPAKGVAVPEGWAVVNAIAYLSEPSPSGNPFVSITEMSASCRGGWEWYH